MHLRKNKSKGIAIDGQKIKKASELLGLLNVVFFLLKIFPLSKTGLQKEEDLQIWSFASSTAFIFIT